MTRAAFLRRWRADVADAERALLKDGLLAPLIVVVGRDAKTSIMAPDLADDAARAKSVSAARLLAVSTDADLVLFRAEVWAVVASEPLDGVTPATSDRRIEAVAVAASARVSTKIERRLSVREIVRGMNGRPAGLRDMGAVSVNRSLLGGPDGWMTDLLPPRRPTPEQRALAGALLAEMRRR